MLPGGGRDEGESEDACVAREVKEETGLSVQVERLLLDVPAEPPDGTYTRWRSYACAVTGGEASAGGGEGANAELVDVMWLPLQAEGTWPADIKTDACLYPQLLALQALTRA
jgi:8-oxo-dGTP pyrophosphatase MutT (NUDIX family)